MSTTRERPVAAEPITRPIPLPPRTSGGPRRHTTEAGTLAVATVVLLAVLVVLAGVATHTVVTRAPTDRSNTGHPGVSAAPTTSTTTPRSFTRPGAIGQHTTITLPGTTSYTSTKALARHSQTLFIGTYDDADYTKTVGASTVAVADTSTGTVQTTITTSRGLLGLVASPDGRRLYATASVDNVVDVIDVPAHRVIARVPTGNMPQGIAIARDGRTVYVTNYSSGTVAALDTASNAVRATVSVGAEPTELALSPDGRTLAVGHEGAVALLDATSLHGTDAGLGSGSSSPASVTFSRDGRRLFVDSSATTSGSASTLATLDAATGRELNELTMPSLPFSLVAGRRAVYVGQSAIGTDGTGSVLTVSPDGRQLQTTTTIGYSPSSMLLDDDEHLLYAVDGGSTVSIVRVG